MHWIDPDHLPKTEGVVDRFLINPRGEIDGILLADGVEVHVPPHLSGEIRAALRPGASIAVYGVRPRDAAMISAVAIETGPGQRIVDNGPPKHGHEAGHKPDKKNKRGDAGPPALVEASGLVRRPLHGPKGEVRGALLEDGRLVRVAPHEAKDRAELLQAGAILAARGPALTVEDATVIEAKELGASMALLRPVRPKEPKHDEDPKQAKHEGRTKERRRH